MEQRRNPLHIFEKKKGERIFSDEGKEGDELKRTGCNSTGRGLFPNGKKKGITVKIKRIRSE